jgi:hypothetical protein
MLQNRHSPNALAAYPTDLFFAETAFHRLKIDIGLLGGASRFKRTCHSHCFLTAVKKLPREKVANAGRLKIDMRTHTLVCSLSVKQL